MLIQLHHGSKQCSQSDLHARPRPCKDPALLLSYVSLLLILDQYPLGGTAIFLLKQRLLIAFADNPKFSPILVKGISQTNFTSSSSLIPSKGYMLALLLQSAHRIDLLKIS